MRISVLLIVMIGIAVGCNDSTGGEDFIINATSGDSSMRTFKAEVWGDNWFAFYLGDDLIKEDSVSITTERSFNAETFTFQANYPLQLNFIAKDFKANDTGLEYIGTRRQQMGDGGIIAQFTDLETGEVVAVTNNNWQALVIHKAPLDSACANVSKPVAGEGPCTFESSPEPVGWKSPEFDSGQWPSATEHSPQSVRPKGGYDKISWDSSSRIIWGGDLEKDNTVLLRYTLNAP